MKTKQGFNIQDICGVKIIVAEGIQNIDFSKIISVNDTAAFLWTEAQRGDFTEQSLTAALVKEYDVTPETAAKDVHELVQQWSDNGLILP